MEISGKIIAVLPEQGGISKSGSEWKKQEYVLETHEQYPKKICFQLFGSDRIEQAAIREGEELVVSVDIESREYQGRWYTNINAWKVDRPSSAGAPPASSAPPAPASAPQYLTSESSSSNEKDDLPF